MASKSGTLFVVATPIGNLEDMTRRASRVLAEADLVAAEDTRHSARLLQHYGIRTPMQSLHEHNERQQVPKLVDRLTAGDDIALICDAGTPLISDPGYQLVYAARRRGIRVSPVPGPSAALAALSVSGLPSDRFVFEGFLPARASARRRRLEDLREEARTLIIYESAHRIVACLSDLAEIIGVQREAVLARELTKQFETVRAGALAELRDWVAGDPDQQKGEFVVLIQGFTAAPAEGPDAAALRVMDLLAAELPLKQAAALAARITGAPRNALYQHGLGLRDSKT